MNINTFEIPLPKRTRLPAGEKELELDATLPDYCPDIARLIRAECTPFIESCTAAEGVLTASGKAVFDILYESEKKSRLRCAIFTREFSLSAAASPELQGAFAECEPKLMRIGCDILSPRRILAKALIGGSFNTERTVTAKAVLPEEKEGVCFCEKEISYDGRTVFGQEDYRFTETLPLASNEKSISEIVCTEIVLRNRKVSLQPGKAGIGATAYIHLLYENEENEGEYSEAVKTLPITLDYSNEAITESGRTRFSLTVTEKTAAPELDRYGESRAVRLSFTVRLKMHTVPDCRQAVATDMFERGYETLLAESAVLFPESRLLPEKSFEAEAQLPAPVPSPTGILDCISECISASCENAEGGILLRGSFAAAMLTDTAEGIHEFSGNVPFEQYIPTEGSPGCTAEAFVYPQDEIPTLRADGSIGLRIIYGVTLMLHYEKEQTLISGIVRRTELPAEESVGELVFFFPDEGEKLWDIAKKYKIPPQKLISANESRFGEDGRVSGAAPILIKG